MEYLLESEVRPESLGFLAKKARQDSYFDVYNRGEMHQIYKIKTNNVKAYTIRPPLFSIGVNERMRVHVTFLGLTDKMYKDRITVLFAHHANVKNTVEQAWYAVKQIINTPQKRSYVTILFKEEQLRSIAEVNEKEAQRSIMGAKSVTARPQILGSKRLDPSCYAVADSEPISFATSPVSPKTAKPTVRKRTSGLSNYSNEPSEETNEDGNYRGSFSKSKKKNVSQTAEGTEEGSGKPVPVAAKPRSRRKVAAPSTEEEEEAPSPVTKSALPPLRRKQSTTRVAVAAEQAEDEMAEAPIAPKKTRKPVQQIEDEEEAPPKPIPVKPRSRRKTHTPRPPVNEDEEGTQIATKKATSPARTRPTPSNGKPRSRRKISGSSFNPLESIISDSKLVYIIQQDSDNGNEEEEEESDRKTRKKSKDSKKKSSMKRKKEEEEEENE